MNLYRFLCINSKNEDIRSVNFFQAESDISAKRDVKELIGLILSDSGTLGQNYYILDIVVIGGLLRNPTSYPIRLFDSREPNHDD